MAFRTITIKGDPVRGEDAATAVKITPGQLIERTSADVVQKHSTAGGTAARMFALEDENQGKAIGDDYAASARVLHGIFKAGDEVYPLLANGENAVIGSVLESNGDGDLRVQAADASFSAGDLYSAIGIAREALDMSGSSGADPTSRRIRVEIL